ncbi:hypothetical protein GALL_317980 [mine drainage metagenome]|uniref:Type IV pilus modification protein PilV n=1 Tax=mine drainage metagenome TaxID=410659 RepID=A0A1J5RDX5_9ZZZZ
MATRNTQAGSVVLEALIGILIFSMGILAIVGLLAASTKSAGDAKYRLDASQLANQLVGQMLGSINRSSPSAQQLVALQNGFGSPSGPAYVAWLGNVTAALPGASAVQPTVVINATASSSANAPSSQATITISWNAPNEAPGAHSYTTIAQIR